MRRTIKKVVANLMLLSFSTQSMVALAQTTSFYVPSNPVVQIPKTPYFIGQNLPPNILLTLDDSGSMAWAYVPDSFITTTREGNRGGSFGTTLAATRTFKSVLNPMYYNPEVKYEAPKKADGTEYTTSFATAWFNGFDPSRGSVNLATGYRPFREYDPSDTTASFGTSTYAPHCSSLVADGEISGSGICFGLGVGRTTPTRAYFWDYNPDGTTNCPNTWSPASPSTPDSSCFAFVSIPASQEQNFANWFSFYRTRNLAVVSAATLAFVDVPPDYRVGWQSLNTCYNSTGQTFSSACRGWDAGVANVDARVRLFTASKKQAMWSWVTRLPASNGTPLREALWRAGRYLQVSDSESAYVDVPGSSTVTSNSCRQSYSVMMTDGMWNGAGNTWNPGLSNPDQTAATMPDGKTYSPTLPYMGNSSVVSLADIAFHFWKTDLQPTLTDNIKPYFPFTTAAIPTTADYWNPRNDPATWQHMTGFFVGLGLTPSLTNPQWDGSTFAGSNGPPATGYNAIAAGTMWPAPSSDSLNNVYDLWHAAINSRGEFFSVDRPDALVDAFRKIRNRIDQQSGSASTLATTGLQVQTDSKQYSATYNSNNWDGGVQAYQLGVAAPIWSTDSSAFNTLGATYASNNKVLFKNASGTLQALSASSVANIPTAYKTVFDGHAADLGVTPSELATWLLGDTSNPSLRSRTKLMGDILSSQPIFEGGRDNNYGENAWGDGSAEVYDDYLKWKGADGSSTMKPTVFVGANDGMFHALNADTGARRFSFIPTVMWKKIGLRAAPGYSHEAFVDGKITTHDVFFNDGGATKGWHTVVVVSYGVGARGVFALDVTDPDNPSLLWEFNPNDDLDLTNDDPDLGYITGEPIVARANNATKDWVVAFGNGYGSASNKAMFYVLNLKTGAVMKKLQAGATPAVATAAPANGMSPPALLYLPGKILQFAYAGDWLGNLWRIDTTGEPSAWTIDFGGAPIFQAKDSAGNRQPITAKPRVVSHRTRGRVIIVGTGKLIEVADKPNTAVQTLYGVFDRPTGAAAASRNTMTSQTIVSTSSDRLTTSDTALSVNASGWYLDMLSGSALAGTRFNEAVMYLPERSAIIATAVQPAGSQCDSSTTAYSLSLNPFSGARQRLFDVDANSTTDPDNGRIVRGAIAAPAIVRSSSSMRAIYFANNQRIEFQMVNRANPRASWRQIQ